MVSVENQAAMGWPLNRFATQDRPYPALKPGPRANACVTDRSLARAERIA